MDNAPPTEPKCPLVMIEWEDSAQPASAWRFLSDYEPSGAIRCVSVGWLIRDDKTLKVLAPNMGSIDQEGSLQVSGMIQIPASCVLSIKALDEPTLDGANDRLEQSAGPTVAAA